MIKKIQVFQNILEKYEQKEKKHYYFVNNSNKFIIIISILLNLLFRLSLNNLNLFTLKYNISL
jgi:hypothetical protein